MVTNFDKIYFIKWATRDTVQVGRCVSATTTTTTRIIRDSICNRYQSFRKYRSLIVSCWGVVCERERKRYCAQSRVYILRHSRETSVCNNERTKFHELRWKIRCRLMTILWNNYSNLNGEWSWSFEMEKVVCIRECPAIRTQREREKSIVFCLVIASSICTSFSPVRLLCSTFVAREKIGL